MSVPENVFVFKSLYYKIIGIKVSCESLNTIKIQSRLYEDNMKIVISKKEKKRFAKRTEKSKKECTKMFVAHSIMHFNSMMMLNP